MRSAQVLTIVRKELLETLRDRRTLSMMIGLPVLVYPLLMMGLSRLQESQQAATEARRSIVATWGSVPADLGRALVADTARVEVTPWLGAPDEVRHSIEGGAARPAAAVEDTSATDRERRSGPVLREQENPALAAARALLTARRADAVLVAWPGFEQALASDGLAPVTLYFDSVREDSRSARDRLSQVLATYRESVLARREQARQLPAGFAAAVEVLSRDVAPPAAPATCWGHCCRSSWSRCRSSAASTPPSISRPARRSAAPCRR